MANLEDHQLHDTLDDIAVLLRKGSRITFWAFWLILFLSFTLLLVGKMLEAVGFEIYM